MKLFNIKSARKRRRQILASTNKSYNAKQRYLQAYRKCIYVKNKSLNPLTKLKASKDAEYFKRRLKS